MSVDATGAVASTVTGAIRQAAQKTGASFNYLLATARVESNLNPSAKATSSSAGGLFQFLDQTWLATLKHAGPALGYGQYADAITMNSSGQYDVPDARLRQQILDLRSDPNANALMAGAFTKWNGDWLAAKLNRQPTEGELYLAHFLGAGGAGKLITLAAQSPQASAAEIFPRAAGANRPIFYDKQGEPRSVAQVYDLMVGRYSVARAQGSSAPTSAAGARQIPAQLTAAAITAPQRPFAMFAPTLASVPLPGLAPLPFSVPAKIDNAGPMFHGLFRTVDRPEAVAPVVSALWGAHAVAAPSPANSQASGSTTPSRGGMLDLFRVDG